MALDSDSDPGTADGTDDSRPETAGSVISGRTLSDLTVNAVPVAMLVAFVVGFGMLAPGDLDSDPLLGFHAALIAGVVLVSAVAARAVVRAGGDLDGNRDVSLYDTDGSADGADGRDDGADGPDRDASDDTGESRDDDRPRHNS
ncbi:DUF6684 family protein [Halobaculum rubrum]|uniref:DUF6684 family protein n=1 Tax=Halobaculum rubrum TaxID=2872158 RepID=UPI001CA3A57D|nr:DUF6684 family protein [Halobaculum rubrum]QZY00431.1 hypothetical protein K6T25_04865 [Halobaculum rubrum]